jgi:siroheme synthase-like protein
VSDFPIALHGERIRAVVIGGGAVGTRKALALADAGAQVTVVAPQVSEALSQAEVARSVTIVRGEYDRARLKGANLVIAATDSREINAQIAVDAQANGQLVNITDFPDEGNFHTMALHRSGDVTIAVSAGGGPGAAARIRDAISERFDRRYEQAVSVLRGLRARSLASGDDRWQDASSKLLDSDFCSSVENGTFSEKVQSWR